MSEAEKYIKKLGLEVEAILGDGFKFLKTRQILKRKTEEGFDIVCFSGSNKFSPNIYIGFIFGKKYSEAERIEKLLGIKPSYYEILQNNYNVGSMDGISFSGNTGWNINIDSPPENLASEIAEAIRGVAYPFFSRFSQPEKARNALENNDSWCLVTDYQALLYFNAMLNEIDRFEPWAKSSLSSFEYDRAIQEMQKLVQVYEI